MSLNEDVDAPPLIMPSGELDCDNCTGCAVRHVFSDAALEDCFKGSMRADMHRTVFNFGQKSNEVFSLREGWAARYRLQKNGKRIILNFLRPGDMLVFQQLTTNIPDFFVRAVTHLQGCAFDRQGLRDILENDSDSKRAFLELTSQVGKYADSRIVDFSAKNALERTAAFYALLVYRSVYSGQGAQKNWSSYEDVLVVEAPMTQALIADYLGITYVHSARIHSKLRNLQLIDLRAGVITVMSFKALCELASLPELLGKLGSQH